MKLHFNDCAEAVATMDDSSVDLILTDPPYFKVLDEPWDRQWDDPEKFLAWLEGLAVDWKRVLKPNGSLYVFASPQMASRVEVMLSRHFRVLNHVVWSKPHGKWQRARKEDLRSFFPCTERVIFCEQFGADSYAKGETGYQLACDRVRGMVFDPIREYLVGEFERAGLNNAEGRKLADAACNTRSMASRHYFTRNQWALPTEPHYMALRNMLNACGDPDGAPYLRRPWSSNREQYEELREQYEELREQYEELRRPFGVTADVPYTDVWTFKSTPARKGRHPCEKPQDLLRHIIESSSRPGAVVLDPFMGSGATGEACHALGREFVGVEVSEHYFPLILDKLGNLV